MSELLGRELGECDVAIIGGGPAGSAAALTLLRYSKLRPVVVERSHYDEWRVGETLSPGVPPLLGYLGAESVLADCGSSSGASPMGQRRAYGTSAAWGTSDVVSRDFLFTGGGDAWHLDRVRFDASLAKLVSERGGLVLPGTVVRDVESQWLLTVAERGGSTTPLRTRFVIDASGRHASFARAQGARPVSCDQLTGLTGIFENGENGSGASTLVEAVEDGWWYSARLPEGRTVVAFMTDSDVVRASHLHERESWLERLSRTRPTRLRTAGATLVHGPTVCPAHSQMLDPVAGEGWIAAGDAAVGFDPLSSMGIGYAINSGIQAARVAASTLAGNGEHARLYASDVEQHYRSYLARRQAYYQIEKRWPQSPFWARRQAAPLLDPPRS